MNFIARKSLILSVEILQTFLLHFFSTNNFSALLLYDFGGGGLGVRLKKAYPCQQIQEYDLPKYSKIPL